jgi:N-acetylglucosaminyldiphosphoundecaprenol N-acetyl-beta-D-mannosaminyltransferase
MSTEPGALPRIDLDGMSLHAITERESVAHILDALDHGHGGWVVTPNLDHARRYRAEPEYRELVAEADLTVADGMPLVWASRLQGTPLPERVAGSSLISTLTEGASRRGYSIFLLGGNLGAADKAAAQLRVRIPGVRIAGTCCPTIGSDVDREPLVELTKQLTDAKPDIVFVGLGSPKQELLIRRLKSSLPRAWWLGVGISFSFLAGEVQRAPHWMQRSGLEWAHRLCQEPRRLAKRYLTQGLSFAVGLFARSCLRRLNVSAKKREVNHVGA